MPAQHPPELAARDPGVIFEIAVQARAVQLVQQRERRGRRERIAVERPAAVVVLRALDARVAQVEDLRLAGDDRERLSRSGHLAKAGQAGQDAVQHPGTSVGQAEPGHPSLMNTMPFSP